MRYLSAIWGCRYFWFSLVKMDLRTRYRRSVLGMGWSLLHPIAMTLIICMMFRHILGNNNVREYAPFLLAGLVCWQYILVSTLQGCQCLFQGESYIRQYPAPIAIYPLRTTLGGAIHFLLGLVVVIGLTWYLHGFKNLPMGFGHWNEAGHAAAGHLIAQKLCAMIAANQCASCGR